MHHRRLLRTAQHVVAAAADADDQIAGARSGSLGERDPEAAFGISPPKSSPARPPRPSLRERDPPGAERLGLSREEVAQFRDTGFVVKRGLIPDAAIAPFREMWWHQRPVTEAGLVRGGSMAAPGDHWPATEAEQMKESQKWGLERNWMGGAQPWPSPTDAIRQGANVGDRVGRLPHKLQAGGTNAVWRWHGIGHDPEFVRATSGHPRMLHMIEALLGGPVKRPCRNRGIYSVFPSAESKRGKQSHAI